MENNKKERFTDVEKSNQLKEIPSISKIINTVMDISYKENNPLEKWVIKKAAKELISEYRYNIISNNNMIDIDDIYNCIYQKAKNYSKPLLKPVINATGVILHTNLGRAPLSKEAIKAIEETAGSYSTLEYDIKSGKRSSRQRIVSQKLSELTKSESAIVLNNNAAGLFLLLSAHAKGKEVIVSRGELVEIGDSFRIPDIIIESGCKLIEVGTTNRTKYSDYEKAITENTAVLLKIQPSNFVMKGFVESVSLQELAILGERYNIPVFEDLGSGAFIANLTKTNIEATIQESIKSGADVVCASADKLMGGPQAGLLIGKKIFIEKCQKHPLARILRIDKLSLAALEATLLIYLSDKERKNIPILRMISESITSIEEKANNIKNELAEKVLLREKTYLGIGIYTKKDFSVIGGGSYPEEKIETVLVCIEVKKIFLLENFLRSYKTPIITRTIGNAICIDPRTLMDHDNMSIIEAFDDFLSCYHA